jgi:alkylation response protein AidB-like acyl-CoA dehydrogenase
MMRLLRVRKFSTTSLFNPTPEIVALRDSVRAFAQNKVEKGARDRDKNEKFDLNLFKQCGELGLLGVT